MNLCSWSMMSSRTMKLKGVNHDVGYVLEGHLMRPTFETKVVHRGLTALLNPHYSAKGFLAKS